MPGGKWWSLLVLREERKGGAVFGPLALTFWITYTLENCAQMSVGVGQGRPVKEHQGFPHSCVPYGSCQNSEGLHIRLLQAHRARARP